MIITKCKINDNGLNLHIETKLKEAYKTYEYNGATYNNSIDKIYIADATKLTSFCDLGSKAEYDESESWVNVFDSSRKMVFKEEEFYELVPAEKYVISGFTKYSYSSNISDIDNETKTFEYYELGSSMDMFNKGEYSSTLYHVYDENNKVLMKDYKNEFKGKDKNVKNIKYVYADKVIALDVASHPWMTRDCVLIKFKVQYGILDTVHYTSIPNNKYQEVVVDIPINQDIQECILSVDNGTIIYQNLANTTLIDQFKERLIAVMVIPAYQPDVVCPVKNYSLKLAPDVESIHKVIMKQMGEIEKRCTIPELLIDLVLKLQYLMSAIESKMYDMAVKIWNMLFFRRRHNVDRCGNRGYLEHEHLKHNHNNCNCNGNNHI